MTEGEREWSQEELRGYLLRNGFQSSDFRPGEQIPQGVKFIDFSPLTKGDIWAAMQFIRSHPEWDEAAFQSIVLPGP